MPWRKTGVFRFMPDWSRQIPDSTVLADTGATSDEPERQVKVPGGGLAGAAEDPALLSYAGLKRRTPDRPEPGVPQVFFRGMVRDRKCELPSELPQDLIYRIVSCGPNRTTQEESREKDRKKKGKAQPYSEKERKKMTK
ncbi:MAG: hypothetical protein ACE15E_00585 [Acidobacteriota bacterium]